MPPEYRYLEIRENQSGQIVHQLEVTDKTEDEILAIRRAWAGQLDHNLYYLEVCSYPMPQ